MRKLMLALCVGSCVSCCAASANDLHGWYIGGTAGLYNGRSTIDSAAPSYSYSNSRTKNDIGFAVLGGWGYRFTNDLYLGTEVGVHTTSFSVNNAGGPANTSLKIAPVSHLVGRLGYVMDRGYMPYILAGFALAKHEGYFEPTAGNSEKHVGYNLGATYGIGTEVPLRDDLYLRFEYSRMNFNNIYSGSAKFSPKYGVHMLKVGLTYNF